MYDGCAKSRLICIRLGKIDYKVGNARSWNVLLCIKINLAWKRL